MRLSELNDVPLFGNTSFRGACPVEDIEVINFMLWVKYQYPKYAPIATHVKNEGKRSHGQARRDKNLGLTKGFADVVILTTPPFVLEMKRRDHTKSKIDADQVKHLETVIENGGFACVALGFEAAKTAFLEHIRGNNNG